jgi:biopolymer transport protein ExbD
MSLRKTRLQLVNYWVLYPIFISSLFLCVCLSQVLSTLNPRVDSHTQIPYLPASMVSSEPIEPPFQGIWLAVHPTSTGVLIQLPDEPRLFWDKTPDTAKVVGTQLAAILTRKVQHLYLKTALSQRVEMTEPLVKIAADNALLYKDLLPVLYAMAEVGLSQYAFEVQLPIKTSSR